jgi:hypothetical protein
LIIRPEQAVIKFNRADIFEISHYEWETLLSSSDNRSIFWHSRRQRCLLIIPSIAASAIDA